MRKTCVVTGSRAEYGLLYWLLKEIENDSELLLQLVVTGMHLSPEFGLTYKVIEQDGFTIDAKVEMLLSSDTPAGISKSIGLGIIGFADAFEQLKPDIVVLLGDRFEIFAAAQAAMSARIPIAHIHGGETTEGAIDEAIRHSITKMSHLHFVAAEPYKKRVVQLGEDPSRVFNYGAIGLDNIDNLKLLTRSELEESIGIKLGQENFLITYHPTTLSIEGSGKSLKNLLHALDQFPKSKLIFTMPNADSGGREIINLLEEYVSKHTERATLFTSLGQIRYLSAISHVDVIIGNSSSAIIEVPSFKKPSVNIGLRQSGRIMAESVICCQDNTEDITDSINKALSIDFRKKIANAINPYGSGGASKKIKEKLKSIKLEDILIKRFNDI